MIKLCGWIDQDHIRLLEFCNHKYVLDRKLPCAALVVIKATRRCESAVWIFSSPVGRCRHLKCPGMPVPATELRQGVPRFTAGAPAHITARPWSEFRGQGHIGM